jgi:hypothetical protein
MPVKALVERRVRMLGELQAMIDKEVTLTAETSASIRRLIDGEVQSLRDAARRDLDEKVPSRQPRPTMEEIAELTKEANAARAAGDTARADELVDRILYSETPVTGAQVLFQHVLDPPDDLLAATVELTPSDAKPAVKAVFNRWWALYPKWVVDNAAMRVLRALQDPALAIDPVLRDRLYSSCKKSVGGGKRMVIMTQAEQTEMANEFLGTLKPELSEAQWEHLTATLETLNQWAAADQAIVDQIMAARATKQAAREANP